MDRRVKLKLAERLAAGLAQQVQSRLSDKEKSIREQYESQLERYAMTSCQQQHVQTHMHRQMSEKEEEFKKKEEEKKKNEEREEQEKDKKLRLANERLHQERPQHLEELFKLNLDSAPIKELKKMMEKMGISPRGCLDRQDLKEKLHANVPELHLKKTGQEQETKSTPSNHLLEPMYVSVCECVCLGSSEPFGGMLIEEKETLKQLTAKLRNRDMEIASLKAQLKKTSSVHVVRGCIW